MRGACDVWFEQRPLGSHFSPQMNAPPQAFEGVLHGLAPTIVPANEMEEIKKRLAAGPPPAQP